MKKEKNGILDTIASILVVFIFLAVFWYLISEWIDLVKNPQTKTSTLIVTGVTIVLMLLIYNNSEFVESLIKE
jgi:divalent metal cation (Fe/Co/Zn/Cd) transporter